MTYTLQPQDDFRHVLLPGQHEAFYFCFTAPDLSLFGWLRLLFGYDRVLTMAVMRCGEQVWVHQDPSACAPPPAPDPVAATAQLALTCAAPWQLWHLRFEALLAEMTSARVAPAALELEFRATNSAAPYQFGPYMQGEQEGRLHGWLRLGDRRWELPFLCYRDHSWGQRPMGAARGWDAFVVPDVCYVSFVQSAPPFIFGRVCAADESCSPVVAPTLTPLASGCHIADPAAGLAGFAVTRAAPPIPVYLGAAGLESVRPAALPGDLLYDEIGPAFFTDAAGQQLLGFWEHATNALLQAPLT